MGEGILSLDNFKVNLSFRGKMNKKRTFLITIILIILGCLFVYFENNNIVITKYTYKNEQIPSQFENLKILQISDLHNAQFGKNQNTIIRKIKKCQPDMIFITGDIIDANRYDLQKAITLVKQVVDIAPTYYVSGNHEAWSNHYNEVKAALLEEKVVVLDNDSIDIKRGKDSITLIGLKDPAFLHSDYFFGTDYSAWENYLKSQVKDNKFEILLSHRPELMDIYKKHNVDLVFSGHVHGGQFRLPFVGGVVGPDQGFFPKYDAGEFVEENTTMILSRGLGNSIIPLRIFNRPELVLVELDR